MRKVFLVNLVKECDLPLGLASIATYLRENVGKDVDIKILDSNYVSPIAEIKKAKPDIVGISAMTVYFHEAKQLAAEIRKLYPNMLIVVGGVHISTHKISFDKCFDIAVIGEGEKTFAFLVKKYFESNNFFSKEDLNKIKGIMFWDGEKKVETEPMELIANLDELPIPDRSFFDKRYFGRGVNRLVDGKFVRAGTIMTGRGCPFKCMFCSTSLFWKKVRFFSPKRIADEVEYLYETYGIEVISIWDDLFGVTKKRVLEIINEFKKRDFFGKVVFITMFKADLVDDEMCVLLKELGVRGLNFGFESGSQKVLSYLKKDKLKVEEIKNAIVTCRKHGIKVFGSLMLGSPGETLEDMKKTIELIDFMKENDVEGAWVFVTSPFPGTELWNYGVEKGLLNDNFDFEYSSHYNTMRPIFLEKNIPLIEFQKIFDIAKNKLSAFSRDSWKNRIKRAVLDPVEFVKKVYNLIFIYSAFPMFLKRFKEKIRRKNYLFK